MTDHPSHVTRVPLPLRPTRDHKGVVVSKDLTQVFSRIPRVLAGISKIETGGTNAQIRLRVANRQMVLSAESWERASVILAESDVMTFLTPAPTEAEMAEVRRALQSIGEMLGDLRAAWVMDYLELIALNKAESHGFGRSFFMAALGVFFTAVTAPLSAGVVAGTAVGMLIVSSLADSGISAIGQRLNASLQSEIAAFLGAVSDLDQRVHRELAQLAADPAQWWDVPWTLPDGRTQYLSDLLIHSPPQKYGASALAYQDLLGSIRVAARKTLWKALVPAMYYLQIDNTHIKTTKASAEAVARWVKGYIEQYPYAFVWADGVEPDGALRLQRGWLTTGDTLGILGDTVPSRDFCNRLFGDNGWPWDTPVAGSTAISTRMEVFKHWNMTKGTQMQWADRWNFEIIT